MDPMDPLYEMNIERLLEMVQERPVLWNKNLDECIDEYSTQQAWDDICKGLILNFEELDEFEKDKTRTAVKKKWSDLKFSWTRWHRKFAHSKKPGSKIKTPSKFIYHERMQFLKDCHRTDADDDPSDDEIHSYYYSSLPADPAPLSPAGSACSASSEKRAKRRKPDHFDHKILEALKGCIPDKNCRHASFFASIAPSLATLDDHDVLEFQLGVLNLLKEIKDRPYSESSNILTFVDNHEPHVGMANAPIKIPGKVKLKVIKIEAPK